MAEPANVESPKYSPEGENDEVIEESVVKASDGAAPLPPPVESNIDPKTPEKKSKTPPKAPSAPKKRKKIVRKGLVSGKNARN